ncbi:metallophosphoesterase [uncultured Pseudoflavonifractor sp.]|uniref:metallophosphoesterase n=1 Tax=uncultured Pseudoflavonifractor sp. TaxID=1221379 RepID=UPI0025E66044|nr:metallophosphoesterase [uncultured Pseudoflavonifractor sp.]
MLREVLSITKRKKRLLCAGVLAAAVAGLAVGLDSRLTVSHYQVESEKLSGGVRVALITDLHCCNYGAGQRELLDAVEAESPDLVLLGGDIVDDDPSLPVENAYTVVRTLAERYPTYYVTGNHEFWSGHVEEIRETMADCGAAVLAGGWEDVELNGQSLRICGVDDPAVGEAEWTEQLAKAGEGADGRCFTILVTHRPERVETYLQYDFDLTAAGHAHGGQWRVPGLINGLLAPDQGLFPKYAGGLYDLGKQVMAVSRGLARESTRIPRLFNRPELVVLDLIPKEQN